MSKSTNQLRHSHCKNCNAPLTGLYCNVCGQKDKDFQPVITQWIQTLWDDFIAVDAKLLLTIKALCIPGMYAVDWIEGKQSRYVPPIKLYIVCSMLYAVISYFIQLTGAEQGVAVQFFSGYVDGLVKGKEGAVSAYNNQIIQILAAILLPFTIISAQVFQRHSKMIVSVIFAISFSTSALLLITLVGVFRLFTNIPHWVEFLAFVVLYVFAVISAKHTYNISWLGSIWKSVLWIFLNGWLLMFSSFIAAGYFEGHLRAQL